MEICTYDEVDPTKVSILNRIGLGYSITAEQIRQIRKIEKRLPKEFAWYLVDNDTVVGQASYLIITAQTKTSLIDICVPQMVCILPQYAKKGLMKKLMDHIHYLTEAEGINHYFLSTSRSRVAEKLYASLGYKIFKQYWYDVGRLDPNHLADNHDLVFDKLETKDLPVVHDLFKKVYNTETGFVHRPVELPLIRKLWGDLKFSDVYVVRDDEGTLGYIWGSDSEQPVLREIILTRRYFDTIGSFVQDRLFYASNLDMKEIPVIQQSNLQSIQSWSISMVKSNVSPIFSEICDRSSFNTPAMDLY